MPDLPPSHPIQKQYLLAVLFFRFWTNTNMSGCIQTIKKLAKFIIKSRIIKFKKEIEDLYSKVCGVSCIIFLIYYKKYIAKGSAFLSLKLKKKRTLAEMERDRKNEE